MVEVIVASRFAGPPRMGHGGYVAGLFAELGVPTRVTIRRPVPLDTPLSLSDGDGGRRVLADGDTVLVESEPAAFELEVPAAPDLETATAAEAGSPSLVQGRGVHPICFGCGAVRAEGDGLRVFAGPCDVGGVAQVAGRLIAAEGLCEGGFIVPGYAVAALDCAGAFAFMARGERPGLLGRLCFELERSVPADRDYVVSGWAVGTEGRKMFAGTALFDADGVRYARALATWFGARPRPAR